MDMNVTEMTVTRALTEIGLLDKKIDKKISTGQFIDLYQQKSGNAISSGKKVDDFSKDAASEMQSIDDLIERRKRIKSAILVSNANVTVKVGDKEYKVIEAIERKNFIKKEQALLLEMRRQLSSVKKAIEDQKPKLDASIEKMLQENLGKDQKPSKEDYKTIAEPFEQANVLRMVDPCKLEERIAKLDSDIDEFLAEVDFVLSESNSVTKITINS